MYGIGVRGHDIGPAGTGLELPGISAGPADATEHHSPAFGPGELGMLNVVSLAVGDDLLEAEGRD